MDKHTPDKIFQIFLSSNGVEIDSRKIVSNQLFFALKGEIVDGHKYVDNVIKRENCYAVIDNPDYKINERTILVNDVIKELQNLAIHYRKHLNVPVFGLTGSNGKTTTKELLATVMDLKFKIHFTQGNYNNHLGVPLTILSAPPDIEFLIIEMGANHIGEIKELCTIADPDYGLITNIGYAHIEGFGSIDGVLKGKSELYDHIENKRGVLFFNHLDDTLKKRLPSGVESIAYPNSSLEVKSDNLGLKLNLTNDEKCFKSPLFGIYNKINIQAAFSVGDYFGIDKKEMVIALSNYNPKMNRSEFVELGSTQFIKDAYNANPSSMRLSIESFHELESKREKVIILGDMKELGNDREEMHLDLYNYVSEFDLIKVITVGSIFKSVLTDEKNVFGDVEELKSHFSSKMDYFKDKIILLKGSRSIRLEEFLSLFN